MIFFRIITALTVVGLLGVIALDLRRGMNNWRMVAQFLWGELKSVARLGGGGAVIIRLTVICFVILALSGFLPIVVSGEHLTGTLLIIHVTIAPLFALLLAAVALLWAHRLRLREDDWRILATLWKRRLPPRDLLIRFLLRAGFWLILLFSLPLILTVILELYPLFGTEGMEWLVSLHAYSALALTLLAFVQIYGMMTSSKDSFEN